VTHERPRFLDSLAPDDFHRAWTIVTELRQVEDQFNGLQTDYRKLASTWLLATFAGVGFVLSSEIDWGLDRELVIALIGVAGGIGIWLLWSLDIMIYQQLLFAAFFWGVKLEERCPALPPVRTTMMLTQIGGNARHRMVWYYIVGVTIPFLIAIAALTLWAADDQGGGRAAELALGLPFALLAVFALGVHLWRASTTSIERVERELRDRGLL
jgi:hypothetical protein